MLLRHLELGAGANSNKKEKRKEKKKGRKADIGYIRIVEREDRGYTEYTDSLSLYS